MREFKFRAWGGKKMHPIAFFTDIWVVYVGGTKKHYIYVEDIKIMQHTGLKDKNGKDIYEGDLLFVEEETEHIEGEIDIDGTVYEPQDIVTAFYIEVYWESDFNDYRFGWSGRGRQTSTFKWDNGTAWDSDELDPEHWSDFGVIGNIYENEELFK